MSHSNGPRRPGARVLAALTALFVVAGMAWLAPVRSAHAASTVQLTIHYWRPDGKYTDPGTCTTFKDGKCGWNLWIWDQSANGGGAGYEFNGTDSFGVVATLTVPCTTCTQMGFIIRE